METIQENLVAAMEDLRRKVAALSERLAKLEQPVREVPVVPVPVAVPGAAPAAAPDAPSGVTEEELLAISAAIAAYLGVRVHIKQIRLIGSHAWAQQGRVFIQASHRLHG